MFISKKKLKQLLDEQYWDGYKKGHDSGIEEGRKLGYSSGFHDGLTREKKGVVMTRTGLYVFENGVTKETIRNYVNDQNNIDSMIRRF